MRKVLWIRYTLWFQWSMLFFLLYIICPSWCKWRTLSPKISLCQYYRMKQTTMYIAEWNKRQCITSYTCPSFKYLLTFLIMLKTLPGSGMTKCYLLLRLIYRSPVVWGRILNHLLRISWSNKQIFLSSYKQCFSNWFLSWCWSSVCSCHIPCNLVSTVLPFN